MNFMGMMLYASLFIEMAQASEIVIPIQDSSAIALGQGFDIETMTWRDVCVRGRELDLPSQNASVQSLEGVSLANSLLEMQGELSAGVAIPGGIASAKAKSSIYSQWSETDKSSVSILHLSYGVSRWHLRDLVPQMPVREHEQFRKKCGTHVVITLQSSHDFYLFVKYLSSDESWLKKTRTNFRVKAAGGLIKKKWTRETIDEGQKVNAQARIAVKASGYFKKILKARLGTIDSLQEDCLFEDLGRCEVLLKYFDEQWENFKILGDRVGTSENLADKSNATSTVLIPYDQAGILFAELPEVEGFSSKKIDALNNLRNSLFELWATQSDLQILGETEAPHLLDDIKKIESKIIYCERYSICEIEN